MAEPKDKFSNVVKYIAECLAQGKPLCLAAAIVRQNQRFHYTVGFGYQINIPQPNPLTSTLDSHLWPSHHIHLCQNIKSAETQTQERMLRPLLVKPSETCMKSSLDLLKSPQFNQNNPR